MGERDLTVEIQKNRIIRSSPLFQYNYGQILHFEGADLPSTYEVHFSNDEFGGEAKQAIGTADGVEIPDEFFLSGKSIYVWIFLHETADDGETEYKIIIPITRRSEKIPAEPTPVQQDVITTAIATLNSAVAQTAEDVETTTQKASDASEYADDAREYAESASSSASTASDKADIATDAAGNASTYAENAHTSEENASTSEDNAELYAERAEQAAGIAGYMFFDVVDGDLIYQRTENVDVDFTLSDGDLYVEAI